MGQSEPRRRCQLCQPHDLQGGRQDLLEVPLRCKARQDHHGRLGGGLRAGGCCARRRCLDCELDPTHACSGGRVRSCGQEQGSPHCQPAELQEIGGSLSSIIAAKQASARIVCGRLTPASEPQRTVPGGGQHGQRPAPCQCEKPERERCAAGPLQRPCPKSRGLKESQQPSGRRQPLDSRHMVQPQRPSP